MAISKADLEGLNALQDSAAESNLIPDIEGDKTKIHGFVTNKNPLEVKEMTKGDQTWKNLSVTLKTQSKNELPEYVTVNFKNQEAELWAERLTDVSRNDHLNITVSNIKSGEQLLNEETGEAFANTSYATGHYVSRTLDVSKINAMGSDGWVDFIAPKEDGQHKFNNKHFDLYSNDKGYEKIKLTGYIKTNELTGEKTDRGFDKKVNYPVDITIDNSNEKGKLLIDSLKNLSSNPALQKYADEIRIQAKLTGNVTLSPSLKEGAKHAAYISVENLNRKPKNQLTSFKTQFSEKLQNQIEKKAETVKAKAKQNQHER